MSVSWNVWVQIERAEVTEDGEERWDNLEPDKLDIFDTFPQAAAFVRSLSGWQENSGSVADEECANRGDPYKEVYQDD